MQRFIVKSMSVSFALHQYYISCSPLIRLLPRDNNPFEHEIIGIELSNESNWLQWQTLSMID